MPHDSVTTDLVILTAHGSRDPRAAATVRAITSAVAAARPADEVTCAFLDFETPALATVLARAAGRRAVVVPLLLTPAYHARVDIPAIVEVARARGADIDVTAALGGDELGAAQLAGALRERLPIGFHGGLPAGSRPSARSRSSVEPHPPAVPLDGLVVAAAGSRDPRALDVIDAIAAELSAQTGIPCRAGHVTGAGQPIAEAIGALRAGGARDLGMAMCFVAPGVLPERAIAAGRACGIEVFGAPLGAAPDLVELINARVDSRQLATAR